MAAAFGFGLAFTGLFFAWFAGVAAAGASALIAAFGTANTRQTAAKPRVARVKRVKMTSQNCAWPGYYACPPWMSAISIINRASKTLDHPIG